MPEPHRTGVGCISPVREPATPNRLRDGGIRVASGDPSAVATAIRADVAHALVAVDFDGTLAPIVPRPGGFRGWRPARWMRSAGWSSERRGSDHLVVTPVPVVEPRRPARGTWAASVRALRRRGAAGRAPDAPDEPPQLATLRARLPGLLGEAGADPDVWIEDKRLSLVVHARKAADPAAALRAADRAGRPALAAELGWRCTRVGMSVEVRLPGYDTGQRLTPAHCRDEPAAACVHR